MLIRFAVSYTHLDVYKRQVPDVFRSCDRVYVPLSTPAPQLMALKERGFRLGVEIPRGMFGQESKVLRLLRLSLIHI